MECSDQLIQVSHQTAYLIDEPVTVSPPAFADEITVEEGIYSIYISTLYIYICIYIF